MLEMHNVKAALLGLAVGDALGVPVEFSSRSKMKKNPVTGMREHGTWNQPIGTWSDDTSLTVAAMDSITRLKKLDKVDVMKNFVRWLRDNEFTANDDAFDCGNTTGAAIDNFIFGATPETCGMRNESSNGNGSLMRILPAVFYAYEKATTDEEALQIVHEFSALTHAHEVSQMACGIYYLICAQILDGKNLKDAIHNGLKQAEEFYSKQQKFLNATETFSRLFKENFAALPEDAIRSSGYVVATLEAVIWCVLNTDDYKSLLLTAVNLGGDTDTVGAIAGGIGGLAYGLQQIPADWLNVLKRRDYLESLAEKFFLAIN
ncbi:MAG: ADP-ribosylglycohydrolase family protein [Selenomonadaceae bacterium]|nr:ADP-ribosylglycohydrolase family protein [Selenomonadaceae bacterium]